jgi:hypothetical protein
MIRITLTLTGALAALAFSAATAHADPDAPTPIGPEFNIIADGGHPWVGGILGYQDFSLLNAPAETFEGVVHFDYVTFSLGDYHDPLENYNISVEKDIAGNVPVGEQYNNFDLGGEYGYDLVYNSIGGTPEAFLTTPFGDIDFPTWFVEAVGPSFFEPSLYFESLPPTTLSAAELPGLAADLPSLLAGLW